MSKTFKDLYPGVFSVAEGAHGFYVDYKVSGESFLYLHTDRTLHEKAYSEGTGAYVPTREEAHILLSQFRVKTMSEQPVHKGITIKYEKFSPHGSHRYVKIISIEALTREQLPHDYLINAEQAVWLIEKSPTSKGLASPSKFLLEEGSIYPYAGFKERMAYIAKAGRNLAEIKTRSAEMKALQSKEKVKKATPWQGVKTVTI